MLTRAERDKWAADLRSGRYLQTQQTLKRDGEYCCLGVFLEGTCGRNPNGLGGTYSFCEKKIGLDETWNFAAMNDTLGLNFAQIANEVDKLPTSD